MSTLKQQARYAGFLYLLLAFTAPLGLLYVPGKIMVAKNAAATAANLRAHETLFRMGIASELVHQVVVIFVCLALYRIFRPIDEMRAKQLVILGSLVSVPIMFVNVLNDLAALTLASGADYLTVFNTAQQEALAYLFLRLHGLGIIIASIFWGLWLFPFGWLVIRSRFIPRVLGYLLWIAGFAYLAMAFARLVMPSLVPFVSQWAMLLETAELPIILWLVIWGAREPKLEPALAT